MRFPIRALLFLFLVLPFAARAERGDPLVVDEAASRAELVGDHVELDLAVLDSGSGNAESRVDVSLVSPADKSLGTVSRPLRVKPGMNRLRIRFADVFKNTPIELALENFPAFRVKYAVTSPVLNRPLSGVISLSEIMPNTFSLQTAYNQRTLDDGAGFRVFVFALAPGTKAGVPGVELTATFRTPGGDGERVQTARLRTGAGGEAEFDFEIPQSAGDVDAPSLVVLGRRGNELHRLESDVNVWYNGERESALIMTDKPLYQPGQLVQFRVLVVAGRNKIRADYPLKITINGPRGEALFKTETRTSQYGEAHATWAVPENAELGQYVLGVSGTRWSIGAQYISVSRYELPAFAVEVRSTRPFYLPGETPRVEIDTRYLFGRPVAAARVRIVEDPSGSYSAGDSKPDGAQVFEGSADTNGHIEVSLALQPLGKETVTVVRDQEAPYEEARFVAYVTDPITERTEKRRFELRFSRQPIHVHLTLGRRLKGDGPASFLISTEYPDGSPASCSVSISRPGEPSAQGMPAKVQTNAYGIGRVESGALSSDDRVLIDVDDGKGARARVETTIRINDSELAIKTNKVLLSVGDSLRMDLRSSFSIGSAIVEVIGGGNRIWSGVVQIRNAAASVELPYSPRLAGRIDIVATYVGPSDSYQSSTSRTVLYPEAVSAVKLEAVPEREIYKPGSEGRIAFQLRTPEGVAQTGLLGIAVRDRGVDQRANEDWVVRPKSTSIWSTLSRPDRVDPAPDELQVAAEFVHNGFGYYHEGLEEDEEDTVHVASAFLSFFDGQFGALKRVLENAAALADERVPRDERALAVLMKDAAGVELAALRDPWGTPYRTEFSNRYDVVSIKVLTNGPDKKPETADDFAAYSFSRPFFFSRRQPLDRAIRTYRERTGAFVRDEKSLREALEAVGVILDSWRDSAGDPYRYEFGINRTNFTVTVSSALQLAYMNRWTVRIAYTEETQQRLRQAVDAYYRDFGRFPENPDAVTALITGIPAELRTDPWGHPYVPALRKDQRYEDLAFLSRTRAFEDIPFAVHAQMERPTEGGVSPVTSHYERIVLRSSGPDGIPDSGDDFDAVVFSRVESVDTAGKRYPERTAPAVAAGRGGAIRGRILGGRDVPLAGVEIAVYRAGAPNAQKIRVLSDRDGNFAAENLEAGYYRVVIEAADFARYGVSDVPVEANRTTLVNATLVAVSTYPFSTVYTERNQLMRELTQNVGIALDPVETAASSAVGGLLATSRAQRRTSNQEGGAEPLPLETPRLRQYFPETLVWQPALETDRAGNAELRFTTADNITTWKVVGLASTKDGRLGVAEAEFRTFQEFFVDHDPPRSLTAGDSIALPVVVRSYLNRNQAVELAVRAESWFKPLEQNIQKVDVGAGATVSPTFAFRAETPVKDGKQRVTATGTAASDSIEKPVTVLPNGREMAHTESRIFNGSAAFETVLPENAISGTAHGTVTIYPDLAAHIVNAIEGVLERPHGCAEQVISSAYPNLLLLRYEKKSGRSMGRLSAKSKKNLEAGYAQLMAYRAREGGFGYWGGVEADPAVTAYAIQFLTEARPYIAVDPDVIRAAVEHLVKTQRPDGSWPAGYEVTRDAFQTLALTSLVAQSLSLPEVLPLVPDSKVVDRAMAFARSKAEGFDEPYALASIALAALARNDRAMAVWALGRIEATAHREGEGTYWDLQSNTPFFSWGLPGRIESSAISVRALAAGMAVGVGTSETQRLIDRGLVFLLRNKDRYGVWYSGQTTARALDVLSLLAGGAKGPARGGRFEILVNGARVETVEAAEKSTTWSPLVRDISKYLRPGTNHVELRGSGAATVQLTETYYVPWTRTVTDTIEDASRFHMDIRFDKTSGKTLDAFMATVNVERVGFRGYGMMLAEIGLPPGMDVDRESLEAALRESNGLFRYEILPDRVVAYLWPKAGGATFQFKFRARYGIDALTTRSILYDYYNPEAQVVLAPTRFIVQ